MRLSLIRREQKKKLCQMKKIEEKVKCCKCKRDRSKREQRMKECQNRVKILYNLSLLILFEPIVLQWSNHHSVSYDVCASLLFLFILSYACHSLSFSSSLSFFWPIFAYAYLMQRLQSLCFYRFSDHGCCCCFFCLIPLSKFIGDTKTIYQCRFTL